MKNLAFFLLMVVFLSIGCNNEKKSGSINTNIEEKDSVSKVISTQNKNTKKPKQIIKEKNKLNPDSNSNFKYGHLKSFTPNMYKNDRLTEVDSAYFHDILKQIDGYSYIYEPAIKNYFISRQNDIYGHRLETIGMFWDLCYEGIELLIIDNNGKLLNRISLTEWKSTCDYTSNTTTTFISDSIFIKRTKGFYPGGETNLYNELEYKALINELGQVDTLEIITNKEYEK